MPPARPPNHHRESGSATLCRETDGFAAVYRRRDPATTRVRHRSASGALIEVEVRHGLGLARVVCGRLVQVEAGIGIEAEVALGRAACGEIGGGVVGRARWVRMASMGPAAVMKAMMRMSAPHSGQVRGKTS